MNKKALLISMIAVAVSFIGGFFFANAYNRKEIESLQSEIGRLKSAPPAAPENEPEGTLSNEEIRQKISEADQNPDNIALQKNLAIGLYRYAQAKQDTSYLPDIARLLERAYEKNQKDYNLTVSLGNIYFDFGESKKDVEALKKSRKFYQHALELNPQDSGVQTDLGMTYLMAEPPDNEKAVTEFQKSLQINPNDERTLENLTRALINLNQIKEAAEYLAKLKLQNPNNESIADLETRLAPKK